MRAWRNSIFGAVAALAALAGCSNNPVPDPQPVQKRAALQSFSNCNDLENYIEDTAVLDMRSQLEQAKKGNYYWGPVYAMGGGVAEDAAAPGAANGASSAPAPKDYTTTNNQVQGVDEADFVKNDGTRIFAISGDRLYVSTSWPAYDLKILSSVKIEGWPQSMFLDEKNHVVVFSSVWDAYPLDKSQGEVDCASLWCGYYYANTVKVTVVDVTNLSAPKVQDEYFLPGWFNNARRIGQSVRMVVADNFRWPQGVKFWIESQDQSLYNDKARLADAYDKLMDDNEKVIRAASLHDWLPFGKRKLASGEVVDVSYQCSDFYKSNAPTKLGLVTVATLNLDDPKAELTRTSIVAEPGQIYASANDLYVASEHWWWWPQPGQKDYTYLHKFDITDPNKALYVASGGVDGHILDQFSMDEDKNGFLRVATTITTREEDKQNPDNWWGTFSTTNRVSVLGEKNGALELVGQTEDLATGERVMSSRFIDDKAFVVTYRQVDPLFTIDLSNPAAPKKVGEVQVEGFSSYIHPLDSTHLLTIGTHIDAQNTWQSRSTQLSIYDVSDLANPKQTFTQQVGSAYGYSEAQWDHLAFNYFPAKKLLAIPFWDWNPNNTTAPYWDYFVSDLRVYGVDAQSGFTPKGALGMKDVYMSWNDYGWTYYWSPWVRRSVMADDFVYAISDAGLRVANIADLNTPIATALFEKAVEK